MSNVAKLKPDQDVELQGVERLKLLRAPFADHHISKLPKETKKQADDRKADMAKGIWPDRCKVCDGFHHPKAVHLDYVGHAALTDRLLDVDPLWSWEPVAYGQDGLPAVDRNGALWIKLTVCGVTRLGYGNADGKSGGDAVKEIIGDALRNAAMRFGAALDLWHKGDLHGEPEEAPAQTTREPKADTQGRVRQSLAVTAALTAITSCETQEELTAWLDKNEPGFPKLEKADLAVIEKAYGIRFDALDPFRSGGSGGVPGRGNSPSDPRAEDVIDPSEIPY